MGVRDKLREKLDREPTDEEVAAEKARKAEKKRKAAEKSTAADETEAPEVEEGGAAAAKTKAAAAAPLAAQSLPDAAASSGEDPPPAKKQRKPRTPRTPKAPKATKGEAAAMQSLAAAAASVQAAGARAVAKALAKTGGGGLESDAFIEMWRSHASGVRAFMSSVEATLSALPDERMSEEQRTEAIAGFAAQLSLPFTPAEDIANAAKEKLEAEAAKKEAERKAKAAKRTPKAPKSPKVDTSALDEAYEILKTFEYDVMNACEKQTKGYLSTAHLRQLAIDKSVYEGGDKNNRMQLIKALLPPGMFAGQSGKSA